MTGSVHEFREWRNWPEGHGASNAELALALTAAIRETIDDFIAKEARVSCAYDIGNGYCFEFAEAVMDRIGLEEEYHSQDGPVVFLETDGFWKETFVADLEAMREYGEVVPDDIPEAELEDMLGSATHQWLVFDGRHYDASAPEGVERFLDLPFFSRQIAGLRERMEGASAPRM